MPRHLLRLILASAVLLLLLPTMSLGQEVMAGLDLYQTITGQSHIACAINTNDLFGPGSDTVSVFSYVQGNPLGSHPVCPGEDLSQVDTIVRRLNDAPIPLPGDGASVSIEIVALDLVSLDPVTITYNNGQNPEEWDLRITLDDTATIPASESWLSRVDGLGGLYQFSSMIIVPRLTFTRISDGQVVVVNGSDEAILWDAGNQAWNWVDHTPPASGCTSNICISPEMGVWDLQSGFLEMISICPDGSTPTADSSWSTVKSLF